MLGEASHLKGPLKRWVVHVTSVCGITLLCLGMKGFKISCCSNTYYNSMIKCEMLKKFGVAAIRITILCLVVKCLRSSVLQQYEL